MPAKIDWDAAALKLLGEYWRLKISQREIGRGLAEGRQLHDENGKVVTHVSATAVNAALLNLSRLGLTPETPIDKFDEVVGQNAKGKNGADEDPGQPRWGADIMKLVGVDYDRKECAWRYANRAGCIRPAPRGPFCHDHGLQLRPRVR